MTFICLTETHLINNDDNVLIQIDNYNTIRINSNSRHTGGVAFYIKNYWKFELIKNFSIDYEIWWLCIKVECNNLTYFLTGLYRAPKPLNMESNFFSYFSDFIEELCGYENVIIMGDININWKLNNNHKKR